MMRLVRGFELQVSCKTDIGRWMIPRPTQVHWQSKKTSFSVTKGALTSESG